ncbi:MAG: hypothetical protein NTU54_04210 [Candidatus Omnitrophica bacterium]|nr:hypothetical protein [Candidatus Omnitrophota bacterium]
MLHRIKKETCNFKILKTLVFGLCFICFLFIFAVHLFAQERFVYDRGGGRNPFIPLITPDGRMVQLDTTEVKRSGDLLVEGIIYDDSGMSYAVVNSQIVKAGDQVQGYEVVTIEKNKIIIKKDNSVKEIPLSKEGAE